MAYTTIFPVNPGIYMQNPLIAATTNATSSAITNYALTNVAQVFMTVTGAGSATVTIYGVGTAVTSGGTAVVVIPISGTTTAATTGQLVNIDYPYYYAIISGITGTSAKVTLNMAVEIV